MIPQGTFLDLLADIEANTLPTLLHTPEAWQTLDVDYEPPRVERLWAQLGDNRLYLHRIHPCERGQALYHPHPWPSAVHLVEGTYEMAVGYGSGDEHPPHATTMVLAAGTKYEMLDQDGWHDVRPLGGTCLSVMLAGKPFVGGTRRGQKPKLNPLSEAVKFDLLQRFIAHFPERKYDFPELRYT